MACPPACLPRRHGVRRLRRPDAGYHHANIPKAIAGRKVALVKRHEVLLGAAGIGALKDDGPRCQDENAAVADVGIFEVPIRVLDGVNADLTVRRDFAAASLSARAVSLRPWRATPTSPLWRKLWVRLPT